MASETAGHRALVVAPREEEQEGQAVVDKIADSQERGEVGQPVDDDLALERLGEAVGLLPEGDLGAEDELAAGRRGVEVGAEERSQRHAQAAQRVKANRHDDELGRHGAHAQTNCGAVRFAEVRTGATPGAEGEDEGNRHQEYKEPLLGQIEQVLIVEALQRLTHELPEHGYRRQAIRRIQEHERRIHRVGRVGQITENQGDEERRLDKARKNLKPDIELHIAERVLGTDHPVLGEVFDHRRLGAKVEVSHRIISMPTRSRHSPSASGNGWTYLPRRDCSAK